MMKRYLIAVVIIFFTNSINAQLTDANFKDAINDCLSTNPVDGMCSDSEYGAMPDWDVSQVTDMSRAFIDKTDFNGDISNWNVSNVTTMNSMFYNAEKFNQPLNNWDVSNVTYMWYMFYEASSFNQPLNNWNVSNVTGMWFMFYNAGKFNQSLNNWDVSNVTNMFGMFALANKFNGDISNWNVSNVTNMESMFNGTKNFNGDISNWNVSKVTSMGRMFYNAEKFNQPLNNWNVSNVTVMYTMFYKASSFNQPLNTKEVTVNGLTYTAWDVSNVNTMHNMFSHASSFNQPLHNWNVSNVTDMYAMFYKASSFNQPLNNWDVSQVKYMEFLFSFTNLSIPNYDSILIGWSKKDVQSNVKLDAHGIDFCNSKDARQSLIDNYQWSIEDAGKSCLMITDANFHKVVKDCLEEDPVDGLCTNGDYGVMRDWDVSRVTNMSRAFQYEGKFNGDISNWNVSNVTNMYAMFDKASSFNQPLNTKEVTDNGLTYTAWDVSNVTTMNNMFSHASSFNQSLDKWNVSKVTAMKFLFSYSNLSTDNYDSTLIGWSKQNVQSNVKLDAHGIDFCNSKDARQSLIDNYQWSIIDAGKSCLITDANFHKVVNNCLEEYPVDGLCKNSDYGVMRDWDVSRVTNMSRAFQYEGKFNGDISNWDVSNVTNMRNMFDKASSFNQPLNEWNVSNVTDMYGMFYEANSFNQHLNNWDVSNVTNMRFMFTFANKFNGYISNWNVSNVTNMSYMFYDASYFNQPLNNWDVSNVNEMKKMLSYSNLSTENYDSILIDWWSEQDVQQDVELGADGINFCKGEAARQSLINNHQWLIVDAGLDCNAARIDDQNQTISIENQNRLDISIYPNPTSDWVYIEGNFTQLKVVVYDLLGKQLINKFITNHLDLSHLEKGIYILQFSDGMKLSTQKIVKK